MHRRASKSDYGVKPHMLPVYVFAPLASYRFTPPSSKSATASSLRPHASPLSFTTICINSWPRILTVCALTLALLRGLSKFAAAAEPRRAHATEGGELV